MQNDGFLDSLGDGSEGAAGDVIVDDAQNQGGAVLPASAYDGSFSSTYAEYFRGFVSKLRPDFHYLCFRDGQYSYVLYMSADLAKSGDIVSGTAGYYRLNTYNGYALSTGVSDVYENVTQGMYYSDFEGCPSLLGGDYYVSLSVLFVLCVIFLFVLLNLLYRLPRHHRRR